MKKKSIVVKQQDLKDCGVCCLQSIIQYYEGYVPLETLRLDTETNLNGTTAYHLVKTAIQYGFDSYGLNLKALNDLEDVVLPAIAHVTINQLNHFVVIYKVFKDYICLMDPARGNIKMKKEEFLGIWSKNLIILYPKYPLPKTKKQNQFLKMIQTIFQREKKLVWRVIFLSFIFTFLTVLTGYYYKILVNTLNQNEEKKVILLFIFVFLAFNVIKLGVYFLRNYYKNLFNKKFDGLLYYDFLKHLFSLPNYFIKDRTTGEIMVRLKELEGIQSVFSELMITLCLDSVLAFSVGMILFYINKHLFFILCSFVLLYVVIGMISGKILDKKALITNESEIFFQSTVVENLDFFLTMKNLNLTDSVFKKIEKSCLKYLYFLHQLNEKILTSQVWTFGLEEILHFSILSVGILLGVDGKLSLIDLITFENLMPFFVQPFKSMIQFLPSLSYIKVSIKKLNDFYLIEEEEKDKGLNVFENGAISISNLNFSYQPFRKIFNHFSLEVPKNQFVYFKGPSGCGKSTLCQMISGLLKVENGMIKIGNTPIMDYSLSTLRKNITYISQKECLLQDTIKNNILLYRKVEEQKFREIATICEIESILNNKPLRYETFVLKDATNLSGGEKQRIILARALLNEFQILILDEALSELNNELEIKIIQNLKAYLKDKTVIYVSHKEHDMYFDSVYDFKEAL